MYIQYLLTNWHGKSWSAVTLNLFAAATAVFFCFERVNCTYCYDLYFSLNSELVLELGTGSVG